MTVAMKQYSLCVARRVGKRAERSRCVWRKGQGERRVWRLMWWRRRGRGVREGFGSGVRRVAADAEGGAGYEKGGGGLMQKGQA